MLSPFNRYSLMYFFVLKKVGMLLNVWPVIASVTHILTSNPLSKSYSKRTNPYCSEK